MKFHNEDEAKRWYFNEVIDNLILLYVIRTELTKEMEKLGIEVHSEEDDDLNSSSNQPENSSPYQKFFSMQLEKAEHLH